MSQWTEAELRALHARESPRAHPPAREIARLLDPALDAAARAPLLEHVGSCAACASALRVLLDTGRETEAFARAHAVQDDLVAPPRRRPAGRRRAGWLAVAATLALGMAVVLRLATLPLEPTLRGIPQAVEPANGAQLAAPPPRVQWTLDPAEAGPVRVTLMDASARAIWVSEPVTGTQVVLPAEHLSEPGTYFWSVARSDGRVVVGPAWFRIDG